MSAGGRALLLWLAVALLGCKSEPRRDTAPAPSSTSRSTIPPRAITSKLTLVKAKPHVPVDVIVKEELERTKGTGQKVLVYVGAPWCEPCRYFHEAAAKGELDDAFPNLRIIEFNLDEDEARLQVAGCRSRMIPLFARVTPEGKCDPERRMMGSVKGPGAVANITPRLRELLSGS